MLNISTGNERKGIDGQSKKLRCMKTEGANKDPELTVRTDDG